jgi:MFS family permease
MVYLFLTSDHWTAAHHAFGALTLHTRKHYMRCSVEYEHAYCRKRFVLSLLDSRVTCPNHIFPIAVQGLGAGAITSSVQIMLSDLVTLRERGTFSGLMALSVVGLSLFLETY